jgi:hypothetical protein
MARMGYSLVHLSDGYLLIKNGYFRRQIYAVFKRESAAADPSLAHAVSTP